MMRIDSGTALTLAALIRSALEAIARIEDHVSQFKLDSMNLAELDSLAYAMHNIYNALENCFEQVSHGFEDHSSDSARWHRELLDKMFLEIKSLRPAVLPEEARSVVGELLGFRHVFRHAYDFKLDKAKIVALWNRWSNENVSVKQALIDFADELEKIGSEP